MGMARNVELVLSSVALYLRGKGLGSRHTQQLSGPVPVPEDYRRRLRDHGSQEGFPSYE
jgi:hypothetical protein